MDDEIDALNGGHTHFEQPTRWVAADEQGQFVEVKDSNRVSVRMKHGVVGDPVPTSTGEDNGIHLVKLP